MASQGAKQAAKAAVARDKPSVYGLIALTGATVSEQPGLGRR